MRSIRVVGCVAILALSGLAVAQQNVKSGPQVGEEIPGPYHPMNVTGPYAGQKKCLYCKLGPSPVAVVFAREVTPQVADLLKKLDDATAKNQKKEMGSYAVFCSDDAKISDQIKELAAKQKIEAMPIAMDKSDGAEEYLITKDAAVTVLLYRDFTVRSNFAFRKGEMKDSDVTKIIADVGKIVK